jgi:hypothetical protein
MNRLLLLCLLITASAHAQRALQKNPNTGTLIEGYKSGANTIEISATGTLLFNSGFTLTGGSHLKTALSLNNVENTALSTWAGTSNLTTLGTITAGIWNGTAIAIANGGTGSTTAANARTALGLGTAAVLDASAAGNATANALVRLDASGVLNSHNGFVAQDPSNPTRQGQLANNALAFFDVAGSGFYQQLLLATPAADHTHTLPARTGTLLHADGNGSALTGLSPYQLAQVSASDGQALVWSTANARWQPGTISGGGGLTIGTTTTSGASAGDLLTSNGTNLQKLTPGTGISTWLATPTLANLNSAVSDADLATTGANTFTGVQTLPVGSAAAPSITWNDTNTGINGSGSNIYFVIDGVARWYVDFNGTLQGTGSYQCLANTIGTYFFARGGWYSMGVSDDCISQRLAADHWIHARTTNAQRLSVTNTYTSTTNHEAFTIDWQTTANSVRVGTVKGSGGGTARQMILQTDGTERIRISASGEIFMTLPTSAGTTGSLWNDGGVVKVAP